MTGRLGLSGRPAENARSGRAALAGPGAAGGPVAGRRLPGAGPTTGGKLSRWRCAALCPAGSHNFVCETRLSVAASLRSCPYTFVLSRLAGRLGLSIAALSLCPHVSRSLPLSRLYLGSSVCVSVSLSMCRGLPQRKAGFLEGCSETLLAVSQGSGGAERGRPKPCARSVSGEGDTLAWASPAQPVSLTKPVRECRQPTPQSGRRRFAMWARRGVGRPSAAAWPRPCRTPWRHRWASLAFLWMCRRTASRGRT